MPRAGAGPEPERGARGPEQPPSRHHPSSSHWLGTGEECGAGAWDGGSTQSPVALHLGAGPAAGCVWGAARCQNRRGGQPASQGLFPCCEGPGEPRRGRESYAEMPVLPWLLLVVLCRCGGLACPEGCRCPLESRVVSCTHGQLREIPQGIPRDTRVLYLDSNEITGLPDGALRELRQLRELYLSDNLIENISLAAFGELGSRLQLLDLSNNRLRQLGPTEAASALRAKMRLYGNPWHCGCSLQKLLEALPMEAETLEDVVCASAAREEYAGQPFALLLNTGIDFCSVQQRTTDVAMLVTMFCWFTVLIAYVLYYVQRNQAETRRHLEYLKSLPIKQPSPEEEEMEEDTLSTIL
nr:leucine-rich repeat-containing protein 3-like isoform X2 [Caretta caretta]